MQILYKPTFVRQYKKLPQELQTEIKEKIELFRRDPNHTFLKTHKLKGKLKDCFSFSVNYDYRIIFEYQENAAVLLTVGNHSVYKS